MSRVKHPGFRPLGDAIGYTLRQWDALTRYLDDGRFAIYNNRVERQMRTVAVGRKNWMFAGSDAGAMRAATIYSLVCTCGLLGIEPWNYLKDVLQHRRGRRRSAAHAAALESRPRTHDNGHIGAAATPTDLPCAQVPGWVERALTMPGTPAGERSFLVLSRAKEFGATPHLSASAIESLDLDEVPLCQR